MKKILIGSKAILHWYPEFTRTPKDTDYAVDIKAKGNRDIEYLYNPVLFGYEEQDIAVPSTLLNLKISHLTRDISWEKHMYDTQFLIKQGNRAFNEKMFYDLHSHWEEIHGKRKTSDLTMDSEEFFDNVVNGKSGFDHDHLHTLIAEVPAYQQILTDGHDVLPDKTKFYALPFSEQCKVVQEEVMVMAYERYRKLPYRVAYTMMLKKFIINHAPIWQVPFIAINYIALEKPSCNYYKKIENEFY